MRSEQQYLLALGVALMVLWLSPGAVSAEEGVVLRGEAILPEEPRGMSALFGKTTVDLEILADQRGRADTQLSKILATGKVSEVAASDLLTGNNIVTNGALAGTSGIPMLIQNSGNGVLIQNAVIVNVGVH